MFNIHSRPTAEQPSETKAIHPSHSLSLASAPAIESDLDLQSLLQSLTRSKMFKLYNSNDEKAREQRRINGQYERHSRSQNTRAEGGVSSGSQEAQLARLQRHLTRAAVGPGQSHHPLPVPGEHSHLPAPKQESQAADIHPGEGC